MANTYSLDLEASSSQYASITDASQTGLDITGDITIEAWVKLEQLPTTAGHAMQIVSKNTVSNSDGYSLVFRNANNKLRFEFFNSSNAVQVDMNAITAADVGRWIHLAVTADVSAGASGVTFYKDGAVVGDTDITDTATSIAATSENFVVGSYRGTTNYIDGFIDEVRVWDDIRTESEIQDNIGTELVGTETNLQGYWKLNNDYTDETSNGNDLTASGSPVFSTDIAFSGELVNVKDDSTLATNLVSYWELEESSGTRVDSHGSNDLTDNNTVGTATGKIGEGADFELGNSEYLSITEASQSGLDLTGDHTFAFWYNPETLLSSGTQTFIDKWLGSGNQRAYLYRLDNTSNDGVGYQLSSTGSVESSGSLDLGTTLSTGTFYHIAITYNTGGVVTAYLNGVKVDEDTGVATSIFNSSSDVYIGSDTGTGSYMDGVLDETGVWSRTLTAGEVSNLYNSGSGLSYSSTNKTLTASVGTFLLTGKDTLFTIVAGTLVATVGEFVLTGMNALFSSTGWTNKSKPSTDWTDKSKNSTDWTDTSKNSTDWTNTTKT
jgi:hypothetical protein